MKHLYLQSFLLLQYIAAFSQVPDIQWQKSLGGTGEDVANFIQQTSDGGYIVAGTSNSKDGNVTGNYGNKDYWVVRLNSTGVIVWQKNLGGTGNDEANSIQQTEDGGYIVAGGSFSNNVDVSGHHGSTSFQDCWVVKLNYNGDITWQKSLGGSLNDYANSIQQTVDGGYIVAGHSFSNDGDVSGHHGSTFSDDFWVVKLSSIGDITWQRSLGGSSYDYANSIQQTIDGGYIVAGGAISNDGDVSGNHGNNYVDYWVVKLNSVGNIDWQKCLGGSLADIAKSVQQTVDGGYIIAGRSNSTNGDITGNHGNDDYWLVKLNSNGSIIWQKSLGGTKSDWANSVHKTADGGYIVAGVSYSADNDVSSNHGLSDYWIVKLDKSNNIVWQKSIGGQSWDNAYSIQQTINGSFIMTGASSSYDGDVTGNHGNYDFWVVKLNSEGVLPVKLINFKATLQKLNKTLLLWQTATEINTAYFEVQRSTDGVHFKPIGKVAATGNSREMKSYKYTDNLSELSYIPPVVYYRLRISDKDGSVDFSNVVFAKFEQDSIILTAMPNPVQDILHLTYVSNGNQALTIKVLDMMKGRVIRLKKVNALKGINNYELQFGDISYGVYILQINGNNFTRTIRIVKGD